MKEEKGFKFPDWCSTCTRQKPKDVCDYCRPCGYESKEEEQEKNKEMLMESNALNMY